MLIGEACLPILHDFKQHISQGDVSAAQRLLAQHTWLIDRRIDSLSRSWLHLAVTKTQANCVRWLCSLGMNLDDQDLAGDRPLSLALQVPSPEIVTVLLDAGAEANIRMGTVTYALHFAAQHRDRRMPQVIQDLVAHGADIEAVDDFGATALKVAVSTGQHDNVRTLLALGAKTYETEICDPDNFQDRNAVEAARQSGYPPLIELLEGWVLARQASDAVSSIIHLDGGLKPLGFTTLR